MSSTKRNSAKQAIIFQGLQTKRGIDIGTLCQRTNWQPHSIRAAISKLKSAGHIIEKIKPAKSSAPIRYRLTLGHAPAPK